MDASKACEQAILIGLDGISFTDHLDIDYPPCAEVFEFNFDKHFEHIEDVKKKFCNRINVIRGLEVGIQEHVIDESVTLIDKYQFDIVIGSLHVLEKLELHNGDYCRGKSKKEAYEGYFNELFKLFSKFENFDVLGHIDIIRRYGDYEDKSLKYSEFADLIDATLKILIEKGKGIEVNTSGFRYNLGSPLPGTEIIKRYRELGGEIITVGSDAHSISHIGYNFDCVKDELISAGFKYYTYFEKRKPVFSKL